MKSRTKRILFLLTMSSVLGMSAVSGNAASGAHLRNFLSEASQNTGSGAQGQTTASGGHGKYFGNSAQGQTTGSGAHGRLPNWYTQGTSSGTGSTSSTSSDSSTIKEVQELLNEKGYDCGTADGLMGPKTSSAIEAYKKDNGLGSGSTIDQTLLNSLRAKETEASKSTGTNSTEKQTQKTETEKQQKNTGSKKSTSSSSKKSSSAQRAKDPYNVYDYVDAEDFAEEWAEEFADGGDYEDGLDAAYDYWERHVGK